ncbi:MAG TPA: glutamate 5-kinase [Candidatus Dormibacteraeota bacterium]|nr:glutamate 5-kinase [Candidatus Dormibacteraeota bacterium]
MSIADQSDGSINHRALLVNARRLVIKVGTGVVCNAENEFDPRQVTGLAASISGLVNAGRQVVLVSSGAVTLGAAELGIHRSRLKDASVTRACAAVGQCKLMQAYAESFRPHGIKVAQVLVTEDDFSDLKRYSILRQTFERLLKLGAVPIVNENDTVTNIYTEQAPVFRDNDRLAALVLSKLDADALVLLSNVDGLLYSPNQDFANATVVSMVTQITAAIRDSARGASATGRGGMTAKLDAAEIAMQAGGMVVIANGKTPCILERVFQGAEMGTLFLPGSRLAGKRRWLAFATTVRGEVTINTNAARALLHRQASLLISGVTASEGEFSAGQVIAVLDPEGNTIGKGIAELGSQQLAALFSSGEGRRGVLVRRENFLILSEKEPNVESSGV